MTLTDDLQTLVDEVTDVGEMGAACCGVIKTFQREAGYMEPRLWARSATP
jgi:hypothetical protein